MLATHSTVKYNTYLLSSPPPPITCSAETFSSRFGKLHTRMGQWTRTLTTAYYHHQTPFSKVLLVIKTPELNNNYANEQAW